MLGTWKTMLVLPTLLSWVGAQGAEEAGLPARPGRFLGRVVKPEREAVLADRKAETWLGGLLERGEWLRRRELSAEA